MSSIKNGLLGHVKRKIKMRLKLAKQKFYENSSCRLPISLNANENYY